MCWLIFFYFCHSVYIFTNEVIFLLISFSSCSFRVLKPPGGGSSDIFGGSLPSTPRSVRNNMASNIFGPTNDAKNGNGKYGRKKSASIYFNYLIWFALCGILSYRAEFYAFMRVIWPPIFSFVFNHVFHSPVPIFLMNLCFILFFLLQQCGKKIEIFFNVSRSPRILSILFHWYIASFWSQYKHQIDYSI